jgi:hypothetical protein
MENLSVSLIAVAQSPPQSAWPRFEPGTFITCTSKPFSYATPLLSYAALPRLIAE